MELKREVGGNVQVESPKENVVETIVKDDLRKSEINHSKSKKKMVFVDDYSIRPPVLGEKKENVATAKTKQQVELEKLIEEEKEKKRERESEMKLEKTKCSIKSCSKKSLTNQCCSRCHNKYYCSRKCQLQDWNRHKKKCKWLEIQKYLEEGVEFEKRRKYDEAIEVYDKIRAIKKIKDENQSHDAHLFRANCIAAKENNFEEALEAYNECVELDKYFPANYYNRGVLFHKNKMFDKAIQDYTETLKIDKNYERALFNRGNIYGQLKKYKLAISDFENCLRLNPKHIGFKENLANLHYDSGDLDTAERYFEECIGVGGKTAVNSHYYIGQINLRRFKERNYDPKYALKTSVVEEKKKKKKTEKVVVEEEKGEKEEEKNENKEQKEVEEVEEEKEEEETKTEGENKEKVKNKKPMKRIRLKGKSYFKKALSSFYLCMKYDAKEYGSYIKEVLFINGFGGYYDQIVKKIELENLAVELMKENKLKNKKKSPKKNNKKKKSKKNKKKKSKKKKNKKKESQHDDGNHHHHHECGCDHHHHNHHNEK